MELGKNNIGQLYVNMGDLAVYFDDDGKAVAYLVHSTDEFTTIDDMSERQFSNRLKELVKGR